MSIMKICKNILVGVKEIFVRKEKYIMGLTCKPICKMKSVIRKLENKLAEEAKLQKEKKESKGDKKSR